MEFFKKHIIFFLLVIAGVIAFFVFGYLHYSAKENLAKTQKELDSSKNKLAQLLRSELAPTASNRESMEAYNESLRGEFQKFRERILRPDLTAELFKDVPDNAQRFTFSHLAFRQELTRMAGDEEYNIQLSPAVENFGFACYPGTAPEPSLIGALYQQRQIIRMVLTNLFQAKPSALLAVRRTPVAGEGGSAAAAPAAARGRAAASAEPVAREGSSDFFEIRPDISAKVPGIVDTIPIQVVFVGRTVALREFLNRLAESGYPIVVRNVEVRSLGQRRETTRGARSAAPVRQEAGVPAGFSVVISENFSEFTVTLEFLVPASSQNS